MEKLNKTDFFEKKRKQKDLFKEKQQLTANIDTHLKLLGKDIEQYEKKAFEIAKLKHLLGKSVSLYPYDDEEDTETYVENCKWKLTQQYHELKRQHPTYDNKTIKNMFINRLLDSYDYNFIHGTTDYDDEISFNNHTITIELCFSYGFDEDDHHFHIDITWEELEADVREYAEQVYERMLVLVDYNLAQEETRKKIAKEQEEKRIAEEKKLYLKLKEKYGETVVS